MKYGSRLIWLFIIAYTLFFSLAAFAKYLSFSYHDFDLAVHVQTVWNIMHGSIFSSILGFPFLGNHTNLILFLIVPLYRIFPHPMTLLFLQSLFLGLGALPLYWLAKEEIDERFATAIAFMYVIYPALGYVNLFEFHPIALSVPLLLFTFYYFKKASFGKFLVFMLLSLLCKENISLIILMFGIYALLNKRSKRWVLVPLVLGGLWFYISVCILMPYFNKGIIDFDYLYSHIGKGLPQVLKALIFHPLFALKYTFLSHYKMKYLTDLFGPLCLLPLLSPQTLLLALPTFMQHLLSLRQTEHTIYYHYTATMIPFIFISAVYGVKFLLKSCPSKRIQYLLLLILIVSSIIWNVLLGPHCTLICHVSNFRRDELDYQKGKFINSIPKDESAVATFEFLPHLAHRKEIFSFHHLYKGTYTLSNRKYELPSDTKYALIDFKDRLTFSGFYIPGGSENIRKFLSRDEWGLVEAVESIALLQRGHRAQYELYEIIKEPEIKNKSSVVINDAIEFLGYDIENRKTEDGATVHVTYYWKCLQETAMDYWSFTRLFNGRGVVVYQAGRPLCYGIYPTPEWKAGEIIREDYWLLLPSHLPGGSYQLKGGVFDYITGQISTSKETNTPIEIELGEIVIGESNV